MKKSTKPFITLMIPTRERANTLKFTLETALDQLTDNYEIIVSDNLSQDNTEGVVRALCDPRIRYINTGRRLSMCDNFEFALNHARGDYVVAIGDDDGIMPGAVCKMQRCIESYPSLLYTWTCHTYVWPTEGSKPYVYYFARRSRPAEITLEKLVRFSLAWGGLRFARLPNVYHSLVSRKVLGEVRARTGRVFHSTQPDVFLSFALPVFADTAVHVGEPLTVYGRSVKAADQWRMARNPNEPMAVRLRRFFEEYAGYRMHRTLYPAVPPNVNMLADAILVAMDLFPEYYRQMSFNYDAFWAWEQAYWNIDSVICILKRRAEIRMHHSLSVPQFLSRYLVARSFALRAHFLEVLRRWRTERNCPENIRDFVLLMGRKGRI